MNGRLRIIVLSELDADQLLALRKRNGLVAVFECERIHACCLTLVERLHGNSGGILLFVIVNWVALQFSFQRGQTLTRPSDTAERISSWNLLSLKSGQTMQAPQGPNNYSAPTCGRQLSYGASAMQVDES